MASLASGALIEAQHYLKSDWASLGRRSRRVKCLDHTSLPSLHILVHAPFRSRGKIFEDIIHAAQRIQGALRQIPLVGIRQQRVEARTNWDLFL